MTILLMNMILLNRGAKKQQNQLEVPSPPLGWMLSSRLDSPEWSHHRWKSQNNHSSQPILPRRLLPILLRSSETDETQREDVQPPETGVEHPRTKGVDGEEEGRSPFPELDLGEALLLVLDSSRELLKERLKVDLRFLLRRGKRGWEKARRRGEEKEMLS